MSAVFVYVTARDKQQALEIGRTLVEERLAACVNVLDGMTSLYWWEGRVNADNEAVLIAKTRQTLVDDVAARVKALHSYDCPCVVSWPLAGGNPEYLAWIENESEG